MELCRFVDTLHLNCEGYITHEAWHMFCKMKGWQDSFPHLMKLWHVIWLFHLARFRVREGSLSKISSKRLKEIKLNIEHLDDLMCVSLNGPH